MTRILFLFLDGVGLGEDDPEKNPLSVASLPTLAGLLNGKRLVAGSENTHSERASLLALDACLGVDGVPQSATGQAALVTGKNVSAAVGYHYGPKPNPDVARHLDDGGLFGHFARQKKKAGLVNAYPAGYFHGINSGKRIYSSIPLAVTRAGLPLLNQEDLFAGKAISADFTGKAWRERLNVPECPVRTPIEAGRFLAELAEQYDFAFFEYWLSDYAGHEQYMEGGVRLLEEFDQVLQGLLERWDDEQGLIVLTSDHGNLEDLSTRRHTENPVPLLLIGNKQARLAFQNAHNLCDVAGGILSASGLSI